MRECVAVFGASNAGEYVQDELKKHSDKWEVAIFVDNYLNQKRKNGVPVYSEKEFLDSKKKMKLIIAMQNDINAQKVTTHLLNQGFEDIWLLQKNAYEYNLPLLDKDGNFVFIERYSKKKPRLQYVEYQVADECNLKCKGCLHFSNIVKNINHASLDEYEHSLRKISEKFSNIEVLRLLGGEPLLNKNIHEFVRISRKYFPSSDLRVVSNGLLITNISRELIDAMRMYKVRFDITQYPPTIKKIEKIIQFLENEGIMYIFEKPTKEFVVRMSRGEENYKETFYKACFSKKCQFLRKNRLYVCPHIPLLYEFQNYFGISIDEKEIKESGFDLDDESVSGWQILATFENPLLFCRYCSSNLRKIPWSVGEADISDWIV